MDLILNFDRKTLSSIKRYIKSHTGNNLNFIELPVFCGCILKGILQNAKFSYLQSEDEKKQFIRLLCEIFYAIDVDFRCAITWSDFTAFCLRVIRNKFKPGVKHSLVQYRQELHNEQLNAWQCTYLKPAKQLLAFDTDVPVVRVIRKNMIYDGNKFNPVAAVARHAKLYFPAFSSSSSNFLSPDKGRVLCVEYSARTNQVAISTSDFLVSYWDVALNSLKGYERMETPQVGLSYINTTEMMLGWGNSGRETNFYVINPVHRRVKYKLPIHTEYILCVCELPAHHMLVSSSIDRSVCIWPNELIKDRTWKGKLEIDLSEGSGFNYTYANVPVATVPAEFSKKVIQLKGHNHAIKTLIYAPESDLIVGAGFDYDAYAWDPLTGVLHMTLVGHTASIVSIKLLNIPEERVISVDEIGVINFWNIQRSLGHQAELVFQIHLQRMSPVVKTIGLYPAFHDGEIIGVLADRMYYLLGSADTISDLCPVRNGLGVCKGSDTVFLATRNAITLNRLSNGFYFEKLDFHDSDRTDTTEVDRQAAKGHNLNKDTSTMLLIEPTDEISAVATDPLGKKLFVGTIEGRVYIFDTITFGLLRKLSDDVVRHNVDGEVDVKTVAGVADIAYMARDETVVVVFTNHAIKIYVGTYRLLPLASRKFSIDDCALSSFSGILNMSKVGGKCPLNPVILRECRYEYHFYSHEVGVSRLESNKSKAKDTDSPKRLGNSKTRRLSSGEIKGSLDSLSHDAKSPKTLSTPKTGVNVDKGLHTDSGVLCMVLSEEFSIIAVSSDDGFIKLYDYLDMKMIALYMAPRGKDSNESVVVCSTMCFAPEMPILLAGDQLGRITAWTVKPLTPAAIFTWHCIPPISVETSVKLDVSKSSKGFDKPVKLQESDFVAPILALKCILWTDNIESQEEMNEGPMISKNWEIIVADDYGCVYTQNITNLVKRVSSAVDAYHQKKQTLFSNNLSVSANNSLATNSISESSIADGDVGLHNTSNNVISRFPYSQCKRLQLLDGLDQKTADRLVDMITRPIGFNQGQTKFAGVNSRSVGAARLLCHFITVDCGPIKAFQVIQPVNSKSSGGEGLKPSGLLVCTLMGKVYLIKWSTGAYIGELADGIIAEETLLPLNSTSVNVTVGAKSILNARRRLPVLDTNPQAVAESKAIQKLRPQTTSGLSYGWTYPDIAVGAEQIIKSMMEVVVPNIDEVMQNAELHSAKTMALLRNDKKVEELEDDPDDIAIEESLDKLQSSILEARTKGKETIGMKENSGSMVADVSVDSWEMTMKELNNNNFVVRDSLSNASRTLAVNAGADSQSIDSKEMVFLDPIEALWENLRDKHENHTPVVYLDYKTYGKAAVKEEVYGIAKVSDASEVKEGSLRNSQSLTIIASDAKPPISDDDFVPVSGVQNFLVEMDRKLKFQKRSSTWLVASLPSKLQREVLMFNKTNEPDLITRELTELNVAPVVPTATKHERPFSASSVRKHLPKGQHRKSVADIPFRPESAARKKPVHKETIELEAKIDKILSSFETESNFAISMGNLNEKALLKQDIEVSMHEGVEDYNFGIDGIVLLNEVNEPIEENKETLDATDVHNRISNTLRFFKTKTANGKRPSYLSQKKVDIDMHDDNLKFRNPKPVVLHVKSIKEKKEVEVDVDADEHVAAGKADDANNQRSLEKLIRNNKSLSHDQMLQILEEEAKNKDLRQMRLHGNQIRFGPYRCKEIFAFVRLLGVLVGAKIRWEERRKQLSEARHRAIVEARNKGGLTKDQQLMLAKDKDDVLLEKVVISAEDDSHKQLFADRLDNELLLEHILSAPQISCHYNLVKQLDLLYETEHTIIYKTQLIPILFYHASLGERNRINVMVEVTYALWATLKSMSPPISRLRRTSNYTDMNSTAPLASPHLHGTNAMLSPAPHGHGGNHGTPNANSHAGGLMSPTHHHHGPHPINGYEGWTIEHYRLIDLRNLFINLCYSDGSVIGQDICDILLGATHETRTCQQLLNLGASMSNIGIHLDSEITGQDILDIFRYCLKVRMDHTDHSKKNTTKDTAPAHK